MTKASKPKILLKKSSLAVKKNLSKNDYISKLIHFCYITL